MLEVKTSEEAIDKIHEVTAKKGEPGLARMRRILNLLGNPERNFKVVHVAGTNGKGSTCEFISQILKENGYSVALYTSPHLLVYNERFEANNRFISDNEFTQYANKVFRTLEVIEKEGYGLPSQFEILTAIAYLFFKDQETDFVILEVGLGGRIDSTNTIDRPVVTAITEIGIDHVAELGSDIYKIAFEKAGIIKKGVPIVSGVTSNTAGEIIAEEAAKNCAPLINTSVSKFSVPNLEMKGEHQRRNARVAMAVIEQLRKSGAVKMSEEKIASALVKTRKFGRYEVLQENPVLIIDAAHNISGIESAIKTFSKEYRDVGRKDSGIALIIGFMADKTCEEMIDLISGFFEYCENLTVIATKPESERALEAEILKEKLARRGLKAFSISDNEEAYDFTMNLKCEYTLCMGSIYLIGNIKEYYNRKGWWKKC